jgi:transcription initiation factor TFIIH subunit 2
MTFDRLFRFLDTEGNTYYGNLTEDIPGDSLMGRKVDVLDGDINAGFRKSTKQASIKKVPSS